MCFLKILHARLLIKPALTLADILRVLRSEAINEHLLAGEFESWFGHKSVGELYMDKDAQQTIEEAMKSGSLQQRNVAGVIAGLARPVS